MLVWPVESGVVRVSCVVGRGDGSGGGTSIGGIYVCE